MDEFTYGCMDTWLDNGWNEYIYEWMYTLFKSMKENWMNEMNGWMQVYKWQDREWNEWTSECIMYIEWTNVSLNNYIDTRWNEYINECTILHGWL